MILTHEQRKKIFEEGKQAAILKQSSIVCPYLDDETTERCAIWMAGYRAFKGDDANYAESLLL
jgi:ribosome modulation factor